LTEASPWAEIVEFDAQPIEHIAGHSIQFGARSLLPVSEVI